MTYRRHISAGARILGKFFAAPAALFGVLSMSVAAAQPNACDMMRAFDSALKERYAYANLAPEVAKCEFASRNGCAFSLPLKVVVRVTHVEPESCAADGSCTFIARQVCVAGAPGATCRTLMANNPSTYRVTGRFSEAEGRWSLDNWKRTPSIAPKREAVVAKICGVKA